MMLACAVVLFLAGTAIFVCDFRSAGASLSGGLERNEYGAGSRTETFRAKVGEGETAQDVDDLEVVLSEQALADEETRKMFDRCMQKIQDEMLGENESLDKVESDLNLMTALEGESVEIDWSLDTYDVMTDSGELREDALAAEGTQVELTAVLTYTQDPDRQALCMYTATVYPKPLTAAERTKEALTAAIQEEEAATRGEKTFNLPRDLGGQAVSYYREMDTRGPVLMFLALVIGVLSFALQKQNQAQEKEDRQKQMLLDYPEILNKLTLFLGAGMTVKRAFRKIVTDYEEQKEVWGERYAYEEMRLACHEMDSGTPEAECYEKFGCRCNIQEYLRFGSLLSQNLRRGTRGLNQLLKVEAAQAFEDRKARAKQLGEEAGTKLLIPMFLMLAVVLIVAVVPAFTSMNI